MKAVRSFHYARVAVTVAAKTSAVIDDSLSLSIRCSTTVQSAAITVMRLITRTWNSLLCQTFSLVGDTLMKISENVFYSILNLIT